MFLFLGGGGFKPKICHKWYSWVRRQTKEKTRSFWLKQKMTRPFIELNHPPDKWTYFYTACSLHKKHGTHGNKAVAHNMKWDEYWSEFPSPVLYWFLYELNCCSSFGLHTWLQIYSVQAAIPLNKAHIDSTHSKTPRFLVVNNWLSLDL